MVSGYEKDGISWNDWTLDQCEGWEMEVEGGGDQVQRFIRRT